MRRSAIVVLIAALVAVGCDDVRHPLDDSETRPDSLEEAQDEAGRTLDELGGGGLAGTPSERDQWTPDDGCGTHPDAPEQGDVGAVLIRSFEGLPEDTVDDLLDEQEDRWRADGHTVDRGSANMAPQVITRINGIGYAVVATPPGVELRAFLPCY